MWFIRVLSSTGDLNPGHLYWFYIWRQFGYDFSIKEGYTFNQHYRQIIARCMWINSNLNTWHCQSKLILSETMNWDCLSALIIASMHQMHPFQFSLIFWHFSFIFSNICNRWEVRFHLAFTLTSAISHLWFLFPFNWQRYVNGWFHYRQFRWCGHQLDLSGPEFLRNQGSHIWCAIHKKWRSAQIINLKN